MPYTFTDKMLPILGVTWHRFDTKREALAFIRWAEHTTRNDDHPCEAYLTGFDEEGIEVKVSNW